MENDKFERSESIMLVFIISRQSVSSLYPSLRPVMNHSVLSLFKLSYSNGW